SGGLLRLRLRNLHSRRGLGDPPFGLGLDLFVRRLGGRTRPALGLDQTRQCLTLGRLLDRGLLARRGHIGFRGRGRRGGGCGYGSLLRRGLSRRRGSLSGGLLCRGRWRWRGRDGWDGRRRLGRHLRRSLLCGWRRYGRGAPAALRALLLPERLTGGLALLNGLLALCFLALALLHPATALFIPWLLALLALAQRWPRGCRGRRGDRLLGSAGRRIG